MNKTKVKKVKNEKSIALMNKAKDLMPGGVNSPVRAFKSVGGNPPFFKKAKGSKMWDEDSNRFIDYVGSWGPMILGHSNPIVTEAIKKQVEKGTSFGAPTKLENEMAEIVIDAVPSIEMVRMVNSGTEATLSAVRLARAYTKREKIVKFKGCYHGHGDMFLVQAGSGAMTLGIPDSPGVTKEVAQNTINVDFNNINQLEAAFEQYPYDISCVILEPITGNMGVIMPLDGYLQKVRDLCDKYDALLIFDEVMTGFRVSYGGAQELFNITPDLTCLGKIIGGGLPVGAYGGKREIMENIAPAGPVYQAGTLSGNPLAMAAGLAQLKELKKKRKKHYEDLDKKAKKIVSSVEKFSDKYGVQVCLTGVGSMFSIFFTDQPVLNYELAKTSNLETFNKYYWSMFNQGIYLPPSQFEANFLSLAHTDEDISATIKAMEKSFKLLSDK